MRSPFGDIFGETIDLPAIDGQARALALVATVMRSTASAPALPFSVEK